MSIVLLNQFFWPDTVATSQLLTDLARQLAEEHRVIVICGKPKGTLTDRRDAIPATISILRTKNSDFNHHNAARLASYVSYLTGTVLYGLRLHRPKVFVTLTTPPVLSVLGSILSSLHGARHYIWEMDVYPDIANDLGYFRKRGFLDQILGLALDWSRRRAAAIIVLGEDMKVRLLARGIAAEKIRVVENWADGHEIQPEPFPPGPLVIQYSGNFGLAHETETIQQVIARFMNHPDFRFTFVGGGSRRPPLQDWCRSNGVRNVEFSSYCQRSDLSKSLAEGHLGLVTQLPCTLGSVVPSKIYGIMAAGRPLLYIGPEGSTPARHIERFKCGWHVHPGDVDGLESLLVRLHQDRQLLMDAGRCARSAFEQHFDRAIGVEQIRNIVTEHSRIHAHQPISAPNESVIGD